MLKRILTLILIVASLISCVVFPTAATEVPERRGITVEREALSINAKAYNFPKGQYFSEKHLSDIPRTFEAWVYIPSSKYNSSGVLFGNYTGIDRDVFLNFEIEAGGVPRLLYSNDHASMRDIKFENAIVPPDEWTHLTIAYGTGKNSRQISCYINGEKKQETFASDWFLIDPSFADNKFCLAGDFRALNENYFKGILSDVAVYNRVRTPEEISADMIAIDEKSDDLLAYYKLSQAENEQDVVDLSGNGHDMRYIKTFLTESEIDLIREKDDNDYAYSMAFLPDIQYTTQSYPEKLKNIYDWLLKNAKKKNIRFVASLGDMTNGNTKVEWDTVKEQTDRLNYVIPYSVLRGNHDITFNDYATYFDEYFAPKDGYYHQYVTKYGGFYDENSVHNTYMLFNAGEVKYLLLNLDFGASDSVLEWANGVLEKYSDRRVIAVTHGYLYVDGAQLGAESYAAPSHYKSTWNDGDDMWEKLLSKHENVEMVVCGHVHSDKIVVSDIVGEKGNTVHQILIDSQATDSRMEGLGLIAMFYFTEDGEYAKIEYYSTTLGRYFRTDNACINLELAPASRYVSAEPQDDISETAPENNDSGSVGVYIAISVTAVIAVSSAAVIFLCVHKRRKNNQ